MKLSRAVSFYHFLTCFLLISGIGPFLIFAASLNKASAWESSVVTLEISRKQYDYLQPWSRREAQIQKVGTVIGPGEILTTAEFLNDMTLIRIQKNGRGKWWNGKAVWLDYFSNLALVASSEPGFQEGLQPVKLADTVPIRGSAQLLRWRNGQFENRKIEINRPVVKSGKLSFTEYMQLEVDSEISGTGWAEPVMLGNKLIGITSSKEEHSCTVIPSSFIGSCLQIRKKRPFPGLGYFAFVWQKSENPASLSFLKLEGNPRGVIVIEVPSQASLDGTFKPKDIILQIDGFDIDSQGDYKDPIYGNLSLENLASRNKWAGDLVRFKVWREGKLMELDYRLPKVDYAVELVPEALYDKEPEYVLLGGLLFQPLTEPFLKSWGNDWLRKAPFRLGYYTQERKTSERPSLVMLSMILPDPHNLGYQDSRYLIVEKMNNRTVRQLSDLIEAQKQPLDGFHIIEFKGGDSLTRIVLEARETDAATQRVLKRYGIEKPFVISSSPPS